MKPKVGRYVKFLSNRDTIKISKIGEIKRSMFDGKIQTVLMTKSKHNILHEYSYHVWEHEVIKIISKATHPEEFL